MHLARRHRTMTQAEFLTWVAASKERWEFDGTPDGCFREVVARKETIVSPGIGVCLELAEIYEALRFTQP